eukprot:CAMPEP_0202686514 /NCGR_PEP_ID=MMETSP1385-20130828/2268_1 /ASSEMBLY_ACC=CAM_ASM_000861 /TAXON_ID=933848 /ORGANISM="Elphidium margaritaceum" /LENGTH=210 /DNA_ID=CAMNT_0049341101 /DNA_START=175 /DNA_END=807 /DNA_ORIENTATION=-
MHHTNNRRAHHHHHRRSCDCLLCHRRSLFHSSSHLSQQAQEQLEFALEDTDTPSQEEQPDDPRTGALQQTSETRDSKVQFLVDEIAKLNLLEVAQLVTALKQTLNLPDTAMMGASMMAAPAAAAPSAASAESDAEPEITQTIFDIVLKSFTTDKKVGIIKEVRNIYKLGLKEAKALVEKAPCTLQAQAPKIEADEIKAKLEAAGAEVALD